ncbi:MAG: D-alanyl-D-alanine carboxypeptidase [Negativicutes bacterium]|nr:D-alanyl-D-alanine carboxypeptidase [Negativicutes bacterium]
MFRRTLSLLVLAVFLLQAVAIAAPPKVLAPPLTVGPPPAIGAEAAVVMVANTRRVLFGQNPNSIMYPASTTKMMTLLLALERGNLDSVVTVSSHAAACEESSLGLRPGDQITLRELLFGMMIVSGNDAAEAVAEHIAGSVPAFVKLMNDRVDKLGLKNTHFSNPHGLPDPTNHYSTAYDLAQIAATGMQNPMFAKIVSTADYTVRFINRGPMQVSTTNKLLRSYPGANGIKTGYTEAAGDCLVAGAKRQDIQLIAVVLNDDDRWTDVPKLLDYGFQRSGFTQ